MGKESRLNPIAMANAVPQKEIDFLKLCDGYGLLGIGLKPHIGDDGMLRILIVANCARVSELVPINAIVPLVLGETIAIPVKDIAARIATVLDGPDAARPPPEIAPS